MWQAELELQTLYANPQAEIKIAKMPLPTSDCVLAVKKLVF